jgi:hypothetical protein
MFVMSPAYIALGNHVNESKTNCKFVARAANDFGLGR